MSTSAPVKKEYDIPIVKPMVVPRELPAPDPERWVPVVTVAPVKVPVRVLR